MEMILRQWMESQFEFQGEFKSKQQNTDQIN